jgi:hypothetical protein
VWRRSEVWRKMSYCLASICGRDEFHYISNMSSEVLHNPGGIIADTPPESSYFDMHNLYFVYSCYLV